MKFFTKKLFEFFKQLEKNNNKEWFDANRHVYESEVKKPFKNLVESVIIQLQKELPEINPNPSKAIFRINRDIRFAKDKSPYKNHVAAVFSRNGTKDMEYPGFYVHIGHKELFAGGGMYIMNKEQLARVRQEIFYNHDEFQNLINERSFKCVYPEILGEKSKVLDAEYKAFAKEQPLIANKSFYYMSELSPEDVLSENFDELLYRKYFKPAIQFNRFLLTALEA